MPRREQGTFDVAIQVIEVWTIQVSAKDEEEALAKAYELPIAKIREDGDHETSETDHATVV